MIILGSITTFVGVISFFFLIDNPKSPVLSLNAEQEILVEERTRDNAVVRTTMIKKDQIIEAIKEVRFWCLCLCCLLLNLQNAMTIYSTQFAKGFGFNVRLFFFQLILNANLFFFQEVQSILLTMGTGASDILYIITSIYIVSRTKQTIYTAIGVIILGIIGLILIIVIPVQELKLIGFYLSWSYPAAYVLVITSVSNNVSGYTKKIFYNGMIMIFYTIGNFCGPLMIVESQAPNYTPAIIGYICANTVVIFLLLIARSKMAQVNKERLSSTAVVMTHVEDDLSDAQDSNYLYRL